MSRQTLCEFGFAMKLIDHMAMTPNAMPMPAQEQVPLIWASMMALAESNYTRAEG